MSNLFRFNENVSLGQNELKDVVIDNLASPPVAPVEGQIYYNTSNNNTFIWNGTTWEDITATGAPVQPRVVTVGTGQDYATIPAAATYLNTVGGGFMILSAQNFAVTSSVNLSNITLYGKGETKTQITLSGAGKLNVSDSTFEYLHIDTNAITDDMAIDILPGTSSLQFEFVRFSVQDATDSLIDSNAAIAPTVTLHFVNAEVLVENGTILKTKALSNINAASKVLVFGANGTNSINIRDWDVTLEGEANVFTTGVLTTIPSNTIFLYPGMFMQGAVNSLPSGGTITLLPGNHVLNQPLQILNDNVEIVGYGDSSIVSASGFTGITSDTPAIEVGINNGTNSTNSVDLSNFTLEVNGNIHGIRVSGGDDNVVNSVVVRKVAGTGGSGSAAKVGIQFTDSTSAKLQRARVTNNRVEGNGGTNYFTDGIHVTGISGFGGLWGYNQGVSNSLIEGNLVDYVRETAYVIVRADSTNLFNNRASRMGTAGGAGAYGVYIAGSSSINMNANIFSGALNTGTIAIGIEAIGLNLTTQNSIFNNNVIDGAGNSGVGFTAGFQIGNATNAQANNNSFQNNIISGADNTTTTAILLRGNADDNIFNNNTISGGANPWDIGIQIANTTSERTSVESNKFTNTTLLFDNGGTSTKMETTHVRATVNPAVNDDQNDGFYVGTFWINTATNAVFTLTNSTPGAAVWVAGTSHTQNTDTGTNANTFVLNNDSSAGNVELQFGTTLGTLAYDTANSRFSFDQPLRVEGNTTIVGQGFIAGNDTAANSDGVLNLGRGSNSWKTLSYDNANNTFSTNNTQLTTRVRQSSTAPFACTAPVSGTLWMDTDTNQLYICDASRSKWLSSSATPYYGEETGTCNAGNAWTNSDGCSVEWGSSLGADNRLVGLYIPYDATIVGYGLSIDNDACTSGSFDVEVGISPNGTNDNSYSLLSTLGAGLTGETDNSTNLNVDIPGNRYILWGIDNNCGQNIDDFNIILYLRWRS